MRKVPEHLTAVRALGHIAQIKKRESRYRYRYFFLWEPLQQLLIMEKSYVGNSYLRCTKMNIDRGLKRYNYKKELRSEERRHLCRKLNIHQEE